MSRSISCPLISDETLTVCSAAVVAAAAAAAMPIETLYISRFVLASSPLPLASLAIDSQLSRRTPQARIPAKLAHARRLAEVYADGARPAFGCVRRASCGCCQLRSWALGGPERVPRGHADTSLYPLVDFL
jgi:hypothetical protein